MFARKKISENVDPISRGVGPKKGLAEGPAKGQQAKLRKAAGPNRRAAFGDITNAGNDKAADGGKKKILGPVKPVAKTQTGISGISKIKAPVKKKTEVKRKNDVNASKSSILDHVSSSQESSSSTTSSNDEQALKNLAAGVPIDRVEEDFSFVIVEDDDTSLKKTEEAEKSLLSIDQENYTDVYNVGLYAQDIFDYYKRREKMFILPDYLKDKHSGLTPSMRSILVDWMVEIQENFELNHETLYLAVKLTDMYLSRTSIDKEMLQLVGSVSVFIASKFDERCPPLIEDFTYICDNAFDRTQFIRMEIEVLKAIDFDLGIPISYRFLRRYSKKFTEIDKFVAQVSKNTGNVLTVARLSMETLTLARYILEMSLMEYDLVTEKDSLIAAATLYIAMKMKGEGAWENELVKTSGYTLPDFRHLVVKLNKMLVARPIPQLSTIRSKYSHIVFHEVAKIAPLPLDQIL